MKKVVKTLIATFLFIFLTFQLNAQNSFSGQIVYKITYEGLGLNESMKSMLPGEMVFTLKENKSKSVLKTAMGDQTTIFDGNTKSVINLIDIMGKKVAIRKNTDELELGRKKYNDLKITFSEETKEIAGYKCKKAMVLVNAAAFNGPNTFTVFYTEELGNIGINYSDELFNQIHGVMLQYEINTRGLLMKFLATEVSKKDIDDDEFSIPSDYKETTQDALNKMFGNGMI